MTRRFPPLLTFLLALLLGVPLLESTGAGRIYEQHVNEVEATVLNLRRYENGTYLEVIRDDGLQEWIEIGMEKGGYVKIGQRIAFTPISSPHENYIFGRLRTGHHFRILPQPKGEQTVYKGEDTDGTAIFTDNPKENMGLKEASTDDQNEEQRVKPRRKGSTEKDKEEIIVVTPEQLLIEKEMTEEYYRYLERTNTGKTVRRAKKAMPKPLPYLQ